ncbi:MAG: hypothetical protein HC840_17435 [Leptolyngbyaceae cyanobacterium RM2_2_4]|nr:hypothetical protein [Leptolyngbyaceae cyanobacterium SM1_4_3]NJN90552.1 hypothetical protein [Leptolyngbyaceae cyanobacterium SL_5_14]NJO50926.1 hypothetical protein [Leptolyngbyaceae cyanobacterium RM2_2_4]NJO67335.1 hypothetical protein [Leptolyngbyaceae cyanobacterium RM1_405_57]
MVQAPPLPTTLNNINFEQSPDLGFQLPDPEDDLIPEAEFLRQVETAWQVCDRFDLQTEIWRGRILRAVRDREKRGGDGRGTGFLNWLKDREISKTQAYSLIELANSADTLLEEGYLEPEDVNQFSKRAFVETAQSSPEVQQMVGDAARKGDRITRREVRQLSDEWTAMTSDLIPEIVKEKAANSTIPARYLAPLVREMEKLPEAHQVSLQAEVAGNPDVDTLKQVTAEARYLAKYLNAATNVQALNNEALDLESALEEALRVGCLNSTADLVNQASQLEQAIAKLYTTWKRLNTLSERVHLDSGASTPHLRSLLAHLSPLSGEVLEVQLGDPDGGSFSRTIRLKILPETDS